jgi:hypothetical protein
MTFSWRRKIEQNKKGRDKIATLSEGVAGVGDPE